MERARSWAWGPYSALALWVAGVTLVVDQAHKLWMLFGYCIQDKGRVPVAPFLDLVYVKNVGISYGLLPGWLGPWVLSAFAVAVSVALYVWIAKSATNRLLAISLALVIGGAVGNAIDRVWLGGVADFFSAHAFGFYWYVFNIADVAIVAGVVGLLYDSIVRG